MFLALECSLRVVGIQPAGGYCRRELRIDASGRLQIDTTIKTGVPLVVW
jgi:hypothetical protein